MDQLAFGLFGFIFMVMLAVVMEGQGNVWCAYEHSVNFRGHPVATVKRSKLDYKYDFEDGDHMNPHVCHFYGAHVYHTYEAAEAAAKEFMQAQIKLHKATTD